MIRKTVSGRAFNVVLYQDEDRFWVSKCLDLRGCVSGGKTRVEAVRMIKDAIGGYLESMKKHGERILEPYPLPSKAKLVKVNVRA